jgi:phage gp46-like protein
MADIRVVWDPERMLGDWIVRGNTLDTAQELVTAVAVALFTHRTAEDDDPLPHFASDRRGWWGDAEAGEIHQGWPIGSRLWLLSREKQTDETRARAEAYIREALDHFIAGRIVADYDLAVDWFAPERLGAEITLYRGSGDSIAVRFETLWAELGVG